MDYTSPLLIPPLIGARRLTVPAAAMTPEERAIAESVLFASLFDYPLTLAELRRTLIGSLQTPTRILARHAASERLQAIVGTRDGFFFPRARPELVDVRRTRERYSRALLRRHRRFLQLAAAMPYVRLVALSGSAAHLNVEDGGDLDLFVVTRGAHAWSVTVGLILLAKALRCRRVICANYVMADTRLEADDCDLFTASQLLHLKPLSGPQAHHALLAANPFVFDFYPNASIAIPPPDTPRVRLAHRVKRAVEAVCAVPAWALEGCCRVAYGGYLRAQATEWASPDQVRLERDRLKLHTRSHRRRVLDTFTHAMREQLDTVSSDPAQPRARTVG